MTKNNDNTYIGTKLKYLVDIVAPGFSMFEDDFDIELTCGTKSLSFKKADLIVDENNKYYLCFDSEDFGPGIVQAKITAYVPDADFDEGVRDEVIKFDLVKLLP